MLNSNVQAIEEAKPIPAPYQLENDFDTIKQFDSGGSKQLTMVLARGKKIPRVNTPKMGPAMEPTIAIVASKMVFTFAARKAKAKQVRPKRTVVTLATNVAFWSDICGPNGRMKSSRMVKGAAPRPLDNVLGHKKE